MTITLQRAYGNSLYYIVDDIADMLYDIVHFDCFRSKCISRYDLQLIRDAGISIVIKGLPQYGIADEILTSNI